MISTMVQSISDYFVKYMINIFVKNVHYLLIQWKLFYFNWRIWKIWYLKMCSFYRATLQSCSVAHAQNTTNDTVLSMIFHPGTKATGLCTLAVGRYAACVTKNWCCFMANDTMLDQTTLCHYTEPNSHSAVSAKQHCVVWAKWLTVSVSIARWHSVAR